MEFSAKYNNSFELFSVFRSGFKRIRIVKKNYFFDKGSFDAKIVMLVLFPNKLDASIYG